MKSDIVENATFVIGDALALENEALSLHAPYDVVLSDMAPSTTSNRLGDQTRSYELFIRVLAAVKLLKPGSAFVGKIFMGEDFLLAKKALKRVFAEDRALRPEGTRATSQEGASFQRRRERLSWCARGRFR